MKPSLTPKYRPCDEEKISLKIVLVGNRQVGKTTLLSVLAKSGLPCRGYSVLLDIPVAIAGKLFDSLIVARIYDLRSQRYFPHLHSVFYNNAKGALLVFDITNRASFEALPKWRDIIWSIAGKVPLLICGNKTDLRKQAENVVSIKEAVKLSKGFSQEQELTIPYIELSASKRLVTFITENTLQEEHKDLLEKLNPQKDLFEKPFVSWLMEIVKKNKIKEELKKNDLSAS